MVYGRVANVQMNGEYVIICRMCHVSPIPTVLLMRCELTVVIVCSV